MHQAHVEARVIDEDHQIRAIFHQKFFQPIKNQTKAWRLFYCLEKADRRPVGAVAKHGDIALLGLNTANW